MNVEIKSDETPAPVEPLPEETGEVKERDDDLAEAPESAPGNTMKNPVPETVVSEPENEAEIPSSPEKKPQVDEEIYPWQAMLCYVPGMFWFPVLFHARSRFLWHHGSQGFRLTLLVGLQMVCIGLSRLIIPAAFTIPINDGTSFSTDIVTAAGRAIPEIITLFFSLIVLYLMLCGIINAVGGRYNTLPLIGKIGFVWRKKSKKK